MKKQKIFVAINLPENIKSKLGEYRIDLPAKWTRKDNLHITLNFLGNISDEELVNVCQSVKDTASKYNPFDINLTKISYGPNKNSPRMIWAIGEKTEDFVSLKNNLDKVLNNSENRGFNPVIENRRLVLHITLARIRKWDWQRIEPEERPEIDKDIDLSFLVNSLEVMESVLKRGGPEYTIVESYNL